jgi:hypothetical protein
LATRGFDRLSPNGVRFVFGVFVFPIILSLSKGKLSANGVGFVFGAAAIPIILGLSKGRLSPNGVELQSLYSKANIKIEVTT